jgi:hypothetical protein
MDTSLRALESGWASELAPTSLPYDTAVENDDLDKLNFVMDEPSQQDDTLTFVLWVENATDESVPLAISGFGLMPHLLELPYIGPPLMVPAPPMPTAIQIPPRSRVPYSREFLLSHYQVDQSNWSYRWTFTDHRGQLLASGSVAMTKP